ncbi:LysM peptidoglycan-binding domain-containing protein [bacterium]|nr:LysM peptidoglycan-binding domain-containing protein [bacterium]
MTAAAGTHERNSSLGLVALVALICLAGALLWRFVGPATMLASVPDWSHLRELLNGTQLRDDDVVAVAGGLAWLALAYLTLSIATRLALGFASSVTGGAPWTRTGLRVTEPLTIPLVRRMVDGALAGTIVLTASLQPSLADAHSSPAEPRVVAQVVSPASSDGSNSTDSVNISSGTEPLAAQLPTSYTVVAGDSLWAISERLLGDGFRWTDIWLLNQQSQMSDGRVFTNPNLIYAGWTLELPDDGTTEPPPTPVDEEESEAEEEEAEATPVAPVATPSPAIPQPTPAAAPAGPLDDATPPDASDETGIGPSLPSIPLELLGSAAAVAGGALMIFVFRRRLPGRGVKHHDGQREHRPSGVGDAGRVVAMSRVLQEALAELDFAETEILTIRETDRFLEFSLDCPPGDADAIVAARHRFAREIGCSVDGAAIAPTQVRLKLSRVSRLAGELFSEGAANSPLVAPVGATDDGIYYLNVLAVGSVLVAGGRLETRDLLSSWLATFGSLYTPESLSIAADEMATAHVGDALSHLLMERGHEPEASIADLARRLESVLVGDESEHHSDATHIVAFAGPVADARDATAELDMVLRSGRQHGVVAVATTEPPVDADTSRTWGASIAYEPDGGGTGHPALTLTLPRHPQLVLEPVTIRRQVAERRRPDHNGIEPFRGAIQNGHAAENGNGHGHEAALDLPALPQLRSEFHEQPQASPEPEEEPVAEEDERPPITATPPAPAVLSRQSALPMTDESDDAAPSSGGPVFRVRCFGSLRVETAVEEVNGWTIQKARELLAFLLAHGGAPVLRETVAEALWPDGEMDQVSHQLSNAAYYLRRTLARAAGEVDNQVLVTANQRYHLRSGLFRVDVDAFDAHVARAEKLQGYEALVEYERALDLYTGDFLGDEIYEWAEVYRRDYQKRFVTAAHRAARLAFDSRDPKMAIRFDDAILARDPIDEEAVRSIMRCYAALGDTNAVRRTYKSLTIALRRELEDDSAEPLPETTKLLGELAGERVSAK